MPPLIFYSLPKNATRKITPTGVDEIRSLSAVWNQHEVLNVINPKENTR